MATERASKNNEPPQRGGGRKTIIQMFVFGIIASAIGITAALSIHWFPAQGSTQAETIDTFWDVLLILSVPIFVLVLTVVLFSVRDFRMRAGEEHLDGPPIHGSTKLEVVWTTIPALILIGLVTYAWIVLVHIEKAPADPANERHVIVTGEQFAWTFEYHEKGVKPFKTSQLYLPEGQSVKFIVRSKDVLHDFWIPAMRMKIDAVPGIDTSYRITPKRLGSYPIVCAELCGLGHAFMRGTSHILTPGDFHSWVVRQAGGGAAAGGAGKTAAISGKTVFANNGCGGCHTLADAGSTGTTGPVLDKVLKGKDAAYIKEAIVDPGKKLEPGFPNVMPANFGDTLSPAQLNALIKYLMKATS
jgi:cytochrome c oxidase subunit 2